jgi:hypothetical protein
LGQVCNLAPAAAKAGSQLDACLPATVLLECIAATYAAAGYGEQPSAGMQQIRWQLLCRSIEPVRDRVAGIHHQVQRCVTLLQAQQSKAAAAARVQTAALAADSPSSDGVLLCGLTGREVPAAERMARLALAVVRVQRCLLRVAQHSCRDKHGELVGLTAADAQTKQLAEAGLQLLWAHTHMLHKLWTHDRPQLHRSAGQLAASQACNSNASSSSSSSSRRPVSFRLLPITSVHEKLKFIPAPTQQLYLQALLALLERGRPGGLCGGFATAAEVLSRSLLNENARLLAQEAGAAAAAAAAAAAHGRAAEADMDENTTTKVFAQLQSDTQALTAPAVLLVIELLQLLAAKSETGQLGKLKLEPIMAFEQCCGLLVQQFGMLAACPSAGYAVRRAVVLRQSGQQLLQLLRWRMQIVASTEAATEAASSRRVELGGTMCLLVLAAGAWSPMTGDEGEAGFWLYLYHCLNPNQHAEHDGWKLCVMIRCPQGPLPCPCCVCIVRIKSTLGSGLAHICAQCLASIRQIMPFLMLRNI